VLFGIPAEIDQAALELDEMIRKINSEIDQLNPPEDKQWVYRY